MGLGGRVDNLRHNHDNLFIGITFQFWSWVVSFFPCFLADCEAGVSFELVHGADFGEVDLLVEDMLDCGVDVVGVVMIMGIMVFVVVAAVAMVVAVGVVVVMGHCCFGWWWWWGNGGVVQ